MQSHAPRIGLIGAGGIAHAHIPGWQRLGAQVTVYSERGAPEIARRYELNVANTLDELLAACDIVDICTPTPTHLDLIDAAIDAGRHVVCEKPVSLDLARARRTEQRAIARGLSLFPAHVVRWFPEYVQVKDAAEAGRLGEIAVMRFSRIGEYPSWAEWFSDEQQSGGIIVDQMIHDLDVARWIAGEVKEVYATLVTDQAPAVSAQVLLTHAEGAISTVTGVWGAAGTPFRTAFSVAGSDGTLSYDSTDAASFRLSVPAAAHSAGDRPDSAFLESPYDLELREFLAAINSGSLPRVTWSDGIRATEIALAANESLRTGRPVALLPAAFDLEETIA